MLTNVTFDVQQRNWLKPRLAQQARGLFTFRAGGVSNPPYESLNVGLHVGDAPDAVLANRMTVAEELGVRLAQFVFPEQVHSNHVAVVTSDMAGRGATQLDDVIAGVDGLVTSEPGIALAVQSADCVPILFHDPVRNLIGAAHSGWKGTLGHIAVEVLAVMHQQFGSDAKDVHVALGPSIRACCYEVDARVAGYFRETFSQSFALPVYGDMEHFQLNLQACIRADLVKAGVPSHQIEDCGLCTGCRTGILFSHRKENGKTGRLLGAVVLGEGGAYSVQG